MIYSVTYTVMAVALAYGLLLHWFAFFASACRLGYKQRQWHTQLSTTL